MKIERSWYDNFIEVCCILSLICTLVYLIAVWDSIPDEIPGHYNAAGEIDRITGKGSLIVLPIITWILYIGLSIIEKFPQIWNTGVRITDQNRDRVYRILKNMSGTLKLLLVIVFSYLTINSAMAKPLPIPFLPVSLVVIFSLLIFFSVKLVRAK